MSDVAIRRRADDEEVNPQRTDDAHITDEQQLSRFSHMAQNNQRFMGAFAIGKNAEVKVEGAHVKCNASGPTRAAAGGTEPESRSLCNIL